MKKTIYYFIGMFIVTFYTLYLLNHNFIKRFDNFIINLEYKENLKEINIGFPEGTDRNIIAIKSFLNNGGTLNTYLLLNLHKLYPSISYNHVLKFVSPTYYNDLISDNIKNLYNEKILINFDTINNYITDTNNNLFVIYKLILLNTKKQILFNKLLFKNNSLDIKDVYIETKLDNENVFLKKKCLYIKKEKNKVYLSTNNDDYCKKT